MLIAALVLVFAQPAQAPAAAPPQTPVAVAPTLEAIAVAEGIFAGEELRDQMLAGLLLGMELGVEQERKRLQESGEQVDEELSARLRAAMQSEMVAIIEEQMPRLRREAALLYARNFSIEDLRELRSMMRSPLMGRLNAKMPAIMLEMGRFSERLFEAQKDRVQQRAEEVARQWLEERVAQRGPA